MNTSSAQPTRDPMFHLDSIVFLVEDELFRVYTYYILENSPKIKLRIEEARASHGHNTLLGTDDEHPLPLNDVSKHEFQIMVSLIYPLNSLEEPIERFLAITDWNGTPRLARNLGLHSLCEQYREILKPVIEEMTSIQKLVIARWLAAEDWFCSAVYDLVTRSGKLTTSDAKRLGLGMAFRISRLREEWCRLKEKDNTEHASKLAEFYRFNRYTGYPTQPGIPDQRISQLRLAIRNCFSSELAEMGCPIDKSRQPLIFRDCIDDDQCFVEESERSLAALVKVDHAFSPTKNQIHYHNTIIFQVDNELFKVHKTYFVQHSPVFREMFQLHDYSNQESLEGQVEEHPLHLDGITKRSFGLFLSVIIPKNFIANIELDYEGWKAVLELSVMWRMRSLRKHCIKHMSPLPISINSIEKVLIARKYMASVWLVEGYKELITRAPSTDFISDEEVEQLGSSAVIQLLRIKVRWAQTSEQMLMRDIRSTFLSELERLEEYDMDSQEPSDA